MFNDNSGSVDSGRLQVSVFATDVGKPIDNATVRVSLTSDPTVTIEEITTDNSGQSPIINVEAPPIDFSLQPGSPKPYSEYNIKVIMEGYQTVDVVGAQILPDRLALQNLNMIPVIASDVGQRDYFIEQHTLWGEFPPKIPELAVKPLPESKGLVVLPDPVVPEFIVVHDGVPSNTSATNYYIPFKDYIKNVASCEIYSTWPETSLRANILAILSFTLNRVYTEWYRGKGYNFTVTNSTAYDQAFVYNRNIFEEISVIVDEIFTTFVTKPGIRQPLFTQYCDGSNTTCPNWLSQWGSKSLGDQGYAAIDILKYYYGQNIYLMEARKVEGVPISYPGTSLQEGSTGAAVRTIQEQLNAISDNYPAIGKIRVDGIYGPQTRGAVEKFQSIFNLPQTGVVDFSTWYKISNIFVAVEKLAG